jgi:hypothetical protein
MNRIMYELGVARQAELLRQAAHRRRALRTTRLHPRNDPYRIGSAVTEPTRDFRRRDPLVLEHD